MPSTSFPGRGLGGVRVRTPASYDAQPSRDEGTRALPGEPGYEQAVAKDVLLESLRDTGLERVESIDLTPRRERGIDGKPPANRRGTVSLDVDVPPDQDAVVLLEQDGVYSWHLPTNRAERTRSLGAEPRTAHFEIDVQPVPTRRRRRAVGREPAEAEGPGRPEDARTRGFLGDLVGGAVRAIVFRFVAPAVLDKAVDALEAQVKPGLVHIMGADVASWRRFDRLDELELTGAGPLRLLLFVHGTFSSTLGAFAPLALTPGAEGFVDTLVGAYDAVIGFDHKTLSVDPRANAKELLERLSALGSEREVVIDIVTHSRGGLVTRSFVEEQLPGSGWKAKVDVIVFVAATNAGTHLAHPRRWADLVDMFTNLAVVSAATMALWPGAAPVAAVVGTVVKGIGAFVKYLVAYAAQGQEVPGLQAMVPGGPFVTTLNEHQKGQPDPGTNWYVVSSNFHVDLGDGQHHPPEFPKELAMKLGEGFMDQIFQGDNDLVVDTESMAAIGLPEGGFVKDSLALGTNETVYHTNYFSQLKVIEAIASWLPLGMGAGGQPGDRDLEMAEPPPDLATGGGPPWDFDMPGPDLEIELPDALGEEPVVAAAPGAPPPQPAPAPPAPGAGPAAPQTAAQVAAEMPAEVVVRRKFDVRVRLSRREIEATPGSAADSRTITVDETRPLSVRVVGKKNATVVGPDSDIFTLPAGGGTSELVFTLKASRRGPVTVTVVVLQGTVPLANLMLEGEAVTEPAATVVATSGQVVGDRPLGPDVPELDALPNLQIFEVERGGKVLYEYALRLKPGEPVHRFTSLPLGDRAKYVDGILAQVEDAWTDSGDRPKAFLSRVQDVGATLFEQLFPQEMQEYLWKHRNDLGQLLVYTDEPYMPWELVHLKPPVGPRQKPPRFLAQQGIVRWQLTPFPPPVVRVRSGRAQALVPHYVDPAFQLTEPAFEEQFLTERFGARRVTPTPTGVTKVLRSGRYDLLHFSGHGVADPEDIQAAKVLLAGRRREGHVLPQYLSAANVSENARGRHDSEGGPIVVLNACQVGRGGQQLTTAGGFAKAFLDAGASVFVSCLWSVREQPSRVFVEELYDQLLKGTPIAQASLRAREKARESGDATWLSYVVYARPDAVLDVS